MDTRQALREDFYEALTEFGMCLKTALSTQSFFQDKAFTEQDIRRYKSDLKWFSEFRKTVRIDAQEAVDYSAYEGITIDGRVDTVMSKGRILISDDAYHGEKGHGVYLRRGLSTYLQ